MTPPSVRGQDRPVPVSGKPHPWGGLGTKGFACSRYPLFGYEVWENMYLLYGTTCCTDMQGSSTLAAERMAG
jgi:hypothetical protein